jgi:pimeloyl-ACP methyl ester carboxylesterase
MIKTLLLLALIVACAPLASFGAPAPAPKETRPPGLTSGALANRSFLVSTSEGAGLARYFGNGSLDGSQTATRAIIIVHGVLRNADTYFATGELTLHAAHADDTLLIAPQFVEAGDLKGHDVPATTLRWSDDWAGGAPAIAPAPISTYSVFDAMLDRLADRTHFPKLSSIVVVGHSAGGQIVQRYAVVGNGPSLIANSGVRVHLIVSNPSSYLYFGEERPYAHRGCADFDQWRYGFVGAPPYVDAAAAAYERRYIARDVTYLLGTADTNPREWDLDTSCAGEAQGPYRFARGKAYAAYLKRRHPAGTAQDYAFVPGVGHDNRMMFTSACGIAVIFDRPRSACSVAQKI